MPSKESLCTNQNYEDECTLRELPYTRKCPERNFEESQPACDATAPVKSVDKFEESECQSG